MVEERLAVEGAVAGAGVPAGAGFVDAVVATGNGLEGAGWRGGGRELDRRGGGWLAGLVGLGEVIEEGVEVAGPRAE